MRSNPIRTALIILLVAGCAAIWIASKGKLSFANNRWLASVYCLLMVVCGFYVWQHGMRRHRQIANVPTSRIASAAQGYTEIHGTAENAEAVSPVVGIGGVPCLWYRYEIAKRVDFSSRFITPFQLFYTPVEIKVSETHFAVRDASGVALLFPFGAEVICLDKQVWYNDDTRFTEERIMPGDPIYVLGDFTTGRRTFNSQLALHHRLDEWQQNRTAMLLRFDINKDGVIDPGELESMRREAEAEIAAEWEAFKDGSEVHMLIDPRGDRCFLISTKGEEDLRGHYFFWQGVGLVLFFGGIVGCGAFGLGRLL